MDPTIPTTREKQLTEPSPSFRRASSIGSEPISPRAVKPSALDGLAEGFSEALDFCRPTDVAVAMHPVLFSEVLSQALGRLSGLRVISCDPGEKGVTRIRKLKPRVLVLDEEDLERAGNLLRHLSQILPTTRILVMAGQSSSTRQQKMLRSGAAGIVEKGAGLEGLARAIASASAGKAEKRHSTGTPKSLHREAFRTERPAYATDGRLTSRECEIAERVGCGLRNRDIALRLNISPETVKSHLNNIFRKLQLDGRIALGILAQSRIDLKKSV